jgi:hypothetical protein
LADVCICVSKDGTKVLTPSVLLTDFMKTQLGKPTSIMSLRKSLAPRALLFNQLHKSLGKKTQTFALMKLPVHYPKKYFLHLKM